MLVNTIFATIQLLLGLGIAFRPTVRVALAASIAWALGVWWFGEGLGGVLSGAASPLNGAPGAVIIYALLAVLLWPADRETAAPFTAARAVGAHVARALWLVLWLSLAYFALTPANRAPQALNGMIAGMESGQPGWLSAIDRGAASLVANQGLAASIVLAVALVLIAVGVYLPPSAAKATLVLAIVVALVIWVVGEAFGTILAGGGTDPNSGPLLVLLALAYWPVTAVTADGPRSATRRREGGLMTPAWILDIFAALMLVVAAVSAARLVEARPWQRGSVILDTDMAHLLMGIAMAGMLASSLTTLAERRVGGHLRSADRLVRLPGRAWTPGPTAPARWRAGTARRTWCTAPRWFTCSRRSTRLPRRRLWHERHGRGVGSAMQTLRYPTLAFVFALILIGYSIWDLDQLSGRRYSPATGARVAGRGRGGRPGDGGRRARDVAWPAGHRGRRGRGRQRAVRLRGRRGGRA